MSQKGRPTTRTNGSTHFPTRRSVLKTAGTGIATIGLAGCLGGGDGSTDNPNGTKTQSGPGDSTINVVAPLPLSGPYAGPGKQVQNGIKIAMDHAKKDGLAKEINIQYTDTEVDPSVARTKTQEVLNNEKIDIMIGGFSSSVVLALGDLAGRVKIPLFTMGGGTQVLRQEKCHRYLFTNGSSSWQQASVAYGNALREGIANGVYTVSADYAGYQQVVDYSKSTVFPENDGTYVGNAYVPIGTGDYSSQLAEIENSDADAIGINLFGSDHVTLAKQIREFGLLEDHVLIAPNHGLSLAPEIPPEVLEKEYAALNWYWQMDTDAGKAYNEAFRKRNNTAPTGWGALMYAGFYTALDAMNDVGSKNPEDYINACEGKDYPDRARLWNKGERIRACDHQSMIAMPFVKGTPPADLDESKQNYFNIVNVPDKPEDTMQTCKNAADNECTLTQ